RGFAAGNDGVPYMFTRVNVVGRGRVGSAVAARLAQREIQVTEREPDLVLLCVPDSAIPAVASSLAPRPPVAHVSGAPPRGALAPHARRFGVHPLQTFTRARGPEQLDGAWAAVTSDNVEGQRRGWWLAGTLGLQPFDLADEARALYHAGAVMASNYLVTL